MLRLCTYPCYCYSGDGESGMSGINEMSHETQSSHVEESKKVIGVNSVLTNLLKRRKREDAVEMEKVTEERGTEVGRENWKETGRAITAGPSQSGKTKACEFPALVRWAVLGIGFASSGSLPNGGRGCGSLTNARGWLQAVKAENGPAGVGRGRASRAEAGSRRRPRCRRRRGTRRKTSTSSSPTIRFSCRRARAAARAPPSARRSVTTTRSNT